MRTLLQKAFRLGAALLFPMVLIFGCAADSGDGGSSNGGGQTTKTLSSIEITTPATKTQFTVGDTFSSAGLKIKATYSDGTTSGNLDPTSVSAPDMTTAGEKTVTVTYTQNSVSKTVSYKITVAAASSTSPTATVTLKFLDGNADLKVGCETTSSGYTFTATPPDSSATYTYTWYLDGVALNTNGVTCTVATSKVKDNSKIFVTAVDSALPGVTYSAEYGF